MTRENASSLAVQSRFLHSNQRLCSFSWPFSLCLWITLYGEKFPFPGRLHQTAGRVLCSKREPCCGTTEWWNHKNVAEGSERKRWRHRAVMLWGDNEKHARHCILGQKGKDPFSQAISRLYVPSVVICCHLVVVFRNDILVKGCRKSGQTQWRISDFSWRWYLHMHLKTSQCQLCPITLWPVCRNPCRDQ